jgi:pulcherriminic acid synthase
MASVIKTEPFAGRNGVVISKRPIRNEGSPEYRTYEVHQRERVGESTEKIKPAQLISETYRQNPYPLLEILRENYPCYRDWLSNSYWITPYNEVTSIFTDEANFETRPKTWYYGLDYLGRDLGQEPGVLEAEERLIDAHAKLVAAEISGALASKTSGDLATEFAAQFSIQLLMTTLAIPEEDTGRFASIFWRMQRGTSWNPQLQQEGRKAINALISYLDPIVTQRTSQPGDDLISAMIQVDSQVTVQDVVVTLLERDHETLQGALANMWFLLLTHPGEFEKACSEKRLMKLAYMETLRHSTPVLSAHRFARNEVERYGRLIPKGSRLVCSAAAANRDPRIFKDPDTFIVDRKDMCQREPRGQYRADGLATGIAFGLGKPSLQPAVPEDQPRSHYAIARDTAVTASQILLQHIENIELIDEPHLSSLTVGEMHTCWKLPVTFKAK